MSNIQTVVLPRPTAYSTQQELEVCRRMGLPDQGDGRSRYESDRDKILYSSSLKRLQHITQVAPAGSGEAYHSRYVHSIKAANVARAIARRILLIAATNPEGEGILLAFGGLDEFVTEAGALAHDVGHPPFGHAGESVINKMATGVCTELVGFEGNAQSYRALAKLSRQTRTDPLKLTAATFNAVAKYPWPQYEGSKKYSVYLDDLDHWHDRRSYLTHLGNRRSIESEIVNIADDITYAVHDVEDFFRAGMIPLQDVRDQMDELWVTNIREAVEREYKWEEALREWMVGGGATHAPSPKDPAVAARPGLSSDQEDAITDLIKELPHKGYNGSESARGIVRRYTADLIGRFIQSVDLDMETGVCVGDKERVQILFLKELARHFVFQSRTLHELQMSQQISLSVSFRFLAGQLGVYVPDPFLRHLRSEGPPAQDALDSHLQALARDSGQIRQLTALFPVSMSELVTTTVGGAATTPPPIKERLRLVVDALASMTEERVTRLHELVTGHLTPVLPTI
jgi:dGTPase